MQTGVGVSDRTIARDAGFVRIGRPVIAPIPRVASIAPAKTSIFYGIEVLKPKGWRPVVGLFSRRVRLYRSREQAVEACIAHWARFGRPVRPFRLD